MASLRQIAANQKNAQKSTGPKTDEGKDASRRNSIKHGLAGTGTILRDDDEAAIETRKAQWRPNYLLETPELEFLFDQMVTNAVRLDRCRDEEIQIRLTESQHAALSWDDDRHDEAAELAARLSKRPVQFSRRLQRTKQGVEWMIERWHDLADILDGGGLWTEAQTALALDLMGTPPELRDPQQTPNENPASLVAHQLAHLERRKQSALTIYDEQERDAALKGIPYEPSRPLKNLRRYEATCMRTFLWASDQLKPYRQTPEPAPAPTPPPAPIPPPTPEPQDDPESVDSPIFSNPIFTMSSIPANRVPENRRARRAAAKLARRRSA